MIAWRLTASEADVIIHSLIRQAGTYRSPPFSPEKEAVADLADRLALDLRALAAHDRRAPTAPDAHLEQEYELRTDIGDVPGGE